MKCLCKILMAFIGRRLVRCASEDIGLVDNSSLNLAVTVMQWSSDIFFPLVRQSLVTVSASVIQLRNGIKNSVKNFRGDGFTYCQVASSAGNCQVNICCPGCGQD